MEKWVLILRKLLLLLFQIYFFRTQVIYANVRSETEKNSDSTITTRSFIQIPVTRYDHLTSFVCEATNNAMKQPITHSIELRIKCKNLSI